MSFQRVKGTIPKVICLKCKGQGSYWGKSFFSTKEIRMECHSCAGSGEISCFKATSVMTPSTTSTYYKYYHYARDKLFRETGILR